MSTTVEPRFIPAHYDVYGGIDADKTSLAITFRDRQRVSRSIRMPYRSDHLLNYLRNHFPGQRVALAYEAGPTGYGLYDALTQQGYTCLVVAPSMVPTAPGQRVKTNRLDSIKMTDGLEAGQLTSIHIPSAPYRQLRHLVQLRDTFVRQATASKCRIKALLLFEGIPFPQAPAGSQWSTLVMAHLKQLSCSGAVRFKLDRLVLSLQFAQRQVLDTTKEIRRLCLQEPELSGCIGYLMTIPGIGWIVASHLLARIGDWRQLKHVRQMAAFLGLAPSEHSTGETVNRGPITRTGDSRLQNKLIQGAWSAIRQDPELREFYRRIYSRHPKTYAARKAIVAVARKMTTRIYAVLHEQRPYQIRNHAGSTPLTQEETVCPRERLDDKQSSGGIGCAPRLEL